MADRITLSREVKGKRPYYFQDPATDHLMTMVLELSTELYTVYARLDTLERHLAEKGIVELDALEAFQPDEAAKEMRTEWRELFLQRLFRTVSEDRG